MDKKKAKELEELIRNKYPWLAKALVVVVNLLGKVVGLTTWGWNKITRR